MQLHTALSFNGNCEEAFKFYQQCLGGNIETLMTWGESPMADQVPADWRGKIIHTTMLVEGSALIGSDAPPGRYETPQGFTVAISLEDVDKAERVFAQLSEGGTVTMPLQQTFWATRFGMVNDRFGIPWMVNCGNAD